MAEVENGGVGREKDAAPYGEARPRGRKRRRVSYLTLNKIDTVDYKETAVLKRFLNDRGKILSSRQTGATAKQQRMVAQAIRRARELALLPYVVTEFGFDRREFSPRGPRGARQAPEAEVASPQVTAPDAAPVEGPAESAPVAAEAPVEAESAE